VLPLAMLDASYRVGACRGVGDGRREGDETATAAVHRGCAVQPSKQQAAGEKGERRCCDGSEGSASAGENNGDGKSVSVCRRRERINSRWKRGWMKGLGH
jgi:hypothetical protein